MDLRSFANKIHYEATLPAGHEERFNGYGLMGLPFSSGHVLALRHFPVNSIGPGYSSVWHRLPDGQWHFYADVPPQFACTRYFGKAVARAEIASIDLEWTGPYSCRVTIPSIDLLWEFTATKSWKTGLMNMIGSVLPDAAWKNRIMLKTMGLAAGKMFDLGRIGLFGQTPNQQQFIANPYRIWRVNTSSARIGTEDFGIPAPLKVQANLADFWIPQRGIFALGRAYFEPYNPARHTGIPGLA